MKKIFSNVMLVAAAAMTFFACQKPETINPETSAEDVVLTFSSEKPAFDDETKTEWTGETIQWSEGDAIRVAYTVEGIWQNATGDASGDAKLYKSDALKSAAETAMFNVNENFKGTKEGVHIFYGVYPAPSSADFPNAPVATLVIPSIQTPGLSSFDGSADLMVGVSSDKYTKLPEKEETISLKWNRLVAHANITLTSLNGVTEGETISTIKLTAQDGANLVGSQKVDIQTLEITNDNGESNVVVLNGGNLTIDASGNIEFWACILPETITALTVEVTTDKAIYTREITGINKIFKQNARNTLAVNMATATREAKEAESWVLVTSGETLTEGTYVLVVKETNKNKYTGALDSSNGSASAPSLNQSVKVVGNTLTGVGATVQFDMTIVEGGYKFAVAGQDKNYLYTTNNNNGVRIGTNNNNIWILTADSDMSDAYTFMCSATRRYLGVYEATPDWRCYESINDNIKDRNSEIYLYKKTAGDVQPDTTPKLEVAEESLSLNAFAAEGTVAVTAKNIASIVVRALAEKDSQEEVEWLTVEYADGVITYSAEKNDSEEERTAYIEVYALDADDNEVVAGINVTQAGKVVVDTSFEAGDYWIVETDAQIAMMPLPGDYGYPKANLAKLVDGTYKSFEANIFTIEYRNDDDCYAIKDSNGKYLYMKTKNDGSWYTSYNVSATYESDTKYQWAISANGEGKHIITNLASQYTMAYSSNYGSWGAYEDVSSYALPTLVKAEDPIAVELASISVSGQTTSYNVGEEFEFDGTVTATYNDGSTKIVTPTEVSEPDMSAAGSQTVTVSYTEDTITKTAEYTINITDPNAGGGESVGTPSDTPCYTLDTSNENAKGSNNSYAGDCDVEYGGITWNVTGNAQMQPWRIGGKNLDNVDRTVYSKTAYSSALSKIEFVAGDVTLASWNSLKLEYSTNSDFSDAVTITAPSVNKNSTIVFAPEGGFPAGCYYRFILNVSVGNSNKYVQLKKIIFYGYEN